MSKAYQSLLASITDLEAGLSISHLHFDNDIDKSIEETQTLAKAYSVMVHSFFERYFELLAYSIAQSSYKAFREQGKTSIALLGLSLEMKSSDALPCDYNDPKHQDRLDYGYWISKSLQEYRHTVNNNHGIRGKNLFNLLWPLGVTKEFIGNDIIIKLDSLASKRGIIAHTGECGTSRKLNLVDEKNEVSQLLSDVKGFDDKIDQQKMISEDLSIDYIESMLGVGS